MKKYSQLTLIEREKLFAYQQAGLSFRNIARLLCRDHTTLSREYKRNRTAFTKEYLPCKAQEIAFKKGLKQRTRAPLKSPLTFLYVREHLRAPYNWSPEEVAGRLPEEHPGYLIDTETIYRYIYSSRASQYKLWKHLVNRRRRRMKKEGRRVKRVGKIPGAISIDLRPKEVENRKTVGHWETDNLEGKKTDLLVVSVTLERKTRYSLLNLVKRKASSKTKALVRSLKDFPKEIRLTLTTDNGSENSYHEQITQALGTKVFFCHTYHSWEKGGVENLNGRIRRFLPKGASLDQLTKEDLKVIEEALNTTPRKCLNYLTPMEALKEMVPSFNPP